MSLPLGMLLPQEITPTFSGHETFALRGNWLKKAFDILPSTPNLFARDDAYVLLGVGKNMAQSIRYWGRVCGVFGKSDTAEGYIITPLGRALLDDNGWDPFLVTPASRWLLHWHIASDPNSAFTFFYAFNMIKGGEFSPSSLAQQIQAFSADHGNWRVPSHITITRDIQCMINCYCLPEARETTAFNEETLFCPLTDLGLMLPQPGHEGYRFVASSQPDLPDALIAFAIVSIMHRLGRHTLSFSDLAYAPGSPGRVFRLDEDELLNRLQRIDDVTGGRAYFTDQAGIRQVVWENISDREISRHLLAKAFADEVYYG